MFSLMNVSANWQPVQFINEWESGMECRFSFSLFIIALAVVEKLYNNEKVFQYQLFFFFGGRGWGACSHIHTGRQ